MPSGGHQSALSLLAWCRSQTVEQWRFDLDCHDASVEKAFNNSKQKKMRDHEKRWDWGKEEQNEEKGKGKRVKGERADKVRKNEPETERSIASFS